MIVNIQIEVSDFDAQLILENSVERVINTSLAITNTSKHPDSYVNHIDWEWLKPFITDYWSKFQNQIYMEFANRSKPCK